MTTLRILLVDDHPNIRTFLASRISRETDMDVVCQASIETELAKCLRHASPHVVLIDPYIKGELSFAMVESIIKRAPDVVIVVLTSVADTWQRMEMERMGVYAVLNKEIASHLLVEKLREAGSAFFPTLFPLEAKPIPISNPKILPAS
jgi:DNA-binding NarL/FixJ family response regulator